MTERWPAELTVNMAFFMSPSLVAELSTDDTGKKLALVPFQGVSLNERQGWIQSLHFPELGRMCF